VTVLTASLLASFEPSVRDVNEACLLPSLLYTSEEFYAFERDAIFAHEWLCVGRADQIPAPGDYFTVTIAEEPLIVARTKEGEIAVLSAVCRHRGAVVVEDKGNCLRA
jgi:phenylpropionate dioxygenase-like ring-hydroxylating dioxygenase large terminal subunit